MANLSSPPYMKLVFILFFCCFPVYWVVKIHALGVLPLPVSPDQVPTHTQQGYYHWREGHSTLNNQDLWPSINTDLAASPTLLPFASQHCFCMLIFSCLNVFPSLRPFINCSSFEIQLKYELSLSQLLWKDSAAPIGVFLFSKHLFSQLE